MGLEGFEGLAAALKDLRDPKQTGKVLRAAVRAGMREPYKRALTLVPIGTVPHAVGKKLRGVEKRIVAPGFGKRSIRMITKADRNGQRAYALLGVRKDAYYLVQFVELGTSKMAARPWLRPAFLGSADPQLRAVGEAINEWIRGLARHHYGKGNYARASQLVQNWSGFAGGQNVSGSDGTFGAASQ